MNKKLLRKITRLVDKYADLSVRACGHEEGLLKAALVRSELLAVIKANLKAEGV